MSESTEYKLLVMYAENGHPVNFEVRAGHGLQSRTYTWCFKGTVLNVPTLGCSECSIVESCRFNSPNHAPVLLHEEVEKFIKEYPEHSI